MPSSVTPADDQRERGRQAFARQAWSDAHALLSAADRDGTIEFEDLERLSIATHLLGRDDESVEYLTRGHQEALRLDDVRAAARYAFWLAMEYIGRNEMARAGGWLTRAARFLDGQPDCVEHGYLLVPAVMQRLDSGEFAEASATLDEVAAIAERFGDPDLTTLARLCQGEALIGQAELQRGVALLDEAMVAVSAGEVSPQIVGIVYCSVIETCHGIFDLRRAQEWTAALSRWCDSQPDLVPYRGQCLLYRAELMTLHGAWHDAVEESERAHAQLARDAGNPALGSAVYQRAELHRLRGEFAEAEAAYREASRQGRRPEPGLALLRLAQGDVRAAASSIRRSLDEAADRATRPRLLEASVEINLAAGDRAAARAATDELALIAGGSDAPMLKAMAARAQGAVRLAEGDARSALAPLRTAWTLWRALDAPDEAARTGSRIGTACDRAGDADGAAMELDSARLTFSKLGATWDTASHHGAAGHGAGQSAPSGLTERELEVLRLIATGRTNRSIASELFISEKTVARHVSNIFTKLGLSSRSAATAYAYEHDLLAPT